MIETESLIIGAGLAGLSAGFHLGTRREHLFVEQDVVRGGLCKTSIVDEFHFDCTGHLIHFRTEEGRRIIMDLLKNKIDEHQRRAAIFIQDRFTDYPFQANTFGLPPETIKECILGFAETLIDKKTRKSVNFYDWIQGTFGSGISKYFMVPYNEKLWQHDLRDIALDWVNWSIPKPNLEDVLNGALGIKNRQFGYNPVFYYPQDGGIGLLPNSFPVYGKLMVRNGLAQLQMKKRVATLEDGTQVRYRYLLSTMPLVSLLQKICDAPNFLQSTAEKLQFVSVLNINLGIGRENVVPYHWIYFPEKDKPFYRIGSPSNFSGTVAPKGTSSPFVEVSIRPDSKPDIEEIVKQSIDALKRSRILRDDDSIVALHPVLLKYAYVVYDRNRKRLVERSLAALRRYDVYSFGRYGSWTYSSMEDAVLEGKQIAEKILAM